MTSRLERGSLATVFGGSGFVGRHAIRALAQDGWRIRAATRRPDLAGHLQPMGAVGQIHPVQANLRYPDSVRRAVEGADAVVNLVSILAECRFCLARSARQTFHAVNVAGARAAARAAREAGAKTFVHVSAIGADRNYWAKYARTKAAGEAAVLAEFPCAVILRPSLVFGPEDQLFNRFAAMASLRSPRSCPLIGGARPGSSRSMWATWRRRSPRPAPAGPGRARPTSWAARRSSPSAGSSTWSRRGPAIAAAICASRSGWRRSPRSSPLPLPHGLRPLTVDQVRMLMRHNVVSARRWRKRRTLAGLGIDHPHAMAAIVPAYLERFQPHGQFAHYRS